MTTTTQQQPLNQWTRLLGSYPTSREAIDRVRRLERDHRRQQEYQVDLDKETGRYHIEFRKKV